MIQAYWCTSKRSHRDQTVQSDGQKDNPSNQIDYRRIPLKEADILQIVDAVKKGLSDFAAGTQISNTLPTHQEDEFD